MSNLRQVFSEYTHEQRLNDLRTFVIDYINEKDPELGDAIYQALTNRSEMMYVMLEAMAAYLVQDTRFKNQEAADLFRATVTTSAGVDRLLSNQGLTRQVVKPATDTTPAVMESNESCLIRYDLAHYQANTTGTRFGYKHHALNFGRDEVPFIDVRKEGNKIIQTFTFSKPDRSGVADAEARSIEKGTGRVIIAAMPDINGVVDEAGLLAYMQRPNIAQETDIISVKLATPRNYSVTVTAYTNDDPRYHIDVITLRKQVEAMTAAKRHLESRISEHDFSYIAKSLGAFDVDVTGIDNALVCEWDEYPECQEVIVNVMGKRPSQ
ncbi:hypothetical protein FRN31_22135 [Vibrio alginolyticus]|nr:hypothetical protein [Vibrio alginolyticus]